jgi:hypothetical protein
METKRTICSELCRWQEAEALWKELRDRIKQPKILRWDTLSDASAVYMSLQRGILQLEAHEYTAAEETLLKHIEAAKDYYGPESDVAIEGRATLAILHVLSASPKKAR